MNEIRIRAAGPEDAEALLAVYAPYVENTAVTFEYTVPSEEEFRQRIIRTLEKYPYLAAESEGEIVGYAYAGSFHPRAAYGWTAETSIYIRQDKKRGGIGRALYTELEAVLKKQNILNLYARIARAAEEDEYLTRDSIRFHERMGYRLAGEVFQCGYKFDRWYNMVCMEKMLGEHREAPGRVKTFAEVREGFGL